MAPNDGYEVRVDFRDHSPPHRVLALVLEWAKLHQAELPTNWRRLQTGEPSQRIAPLE